MSVHINFVHIASEAVLLEITNRSQKAGGFPAFYLSRQKQFFKYPAQLNKPCFTSGQVEEFGHSRPQEVRIRPLHTFGHSGTAVILSMPRVKSPKKGTFEKAWRYMYRFGWTRGPEIRPSSSVVTRQLGHCDRSAHRATTSDWLG